MTEDFKCVKCPEGKYLFDAPENVTTCKSCPENTVCYGGAHAAPIKGYWRANDSSESINECPR